MFPEFLCAGWVTQSELGEVGVEKGESFEVFSIVFIFCTAFIEWVLRNFVQFVHDLSVPISTLCTRSDFLDWSLVFTKTINIFSTNRNLLPNSTILFDLLAHPVSTFNFLMPPSPRVKHFLWYTWPLVNYL